ncbi:serine hydrolase domain-containing protein [Paraglaciecola sp.]|uniref:serine hydrolase domain-containing protein n=1 Tax=Paraglaciecola sp. TaxID=1920173 RepID=UPI003263418A
MNPKVEVDNHFSRKYRVNHLMKNKIERARKYYQVLSVLIILFASIVSFSSLAFQSQTERLQNIRQTMEKLRQEMQIPGMALVIVKDDEIILAEGFGYADVENKTPVSPQTNFAIGSTTKAFTATLAAMMVDDKSMLWDDKVTDYIIWFKPELGEETGNLTIRDMLSNRSGLARNDALWVSGNVTREDILRESMDAIPLGKFRKSFHYNNVLFSAAGEATARAAKAISWDSLLQERIFKPLKMNSSTSLNDQSVNMALGYRWLEHSQSYELLNKKNLDNIAAAGGIHSNIMDMANWLRFNLNRGSFEGTRLLSEPQFEQLWRPVIPVSKDKQYALGWFIDSWNGKKVVEHGGSIQGYAAQVALIPEEGLGFALLTNSTITPLQQGSMEVIWKGLLGSDNPKSNISQQNQLMQYTGRYVANFGPFKETVFTVQVNLHGELSVDIPGQKLYVLNEPDESGKWYLQLTDTIAVSFAQIENEQANLMRLHQSGMNFELPREGVLVQDDVDIAQYAPFIGQYTHEKLPQPITVLISNGRLAVDVPGQMVYELHPPQKDGHRNFRISDTLSAKFSLNSENKGDTVSIFSNGEKQLTAQRIDDAIEKPLPSHDDLMVLMNSKQKIATFRRWGASTMRAKVSMQQAGLSGSLVLHYELTDRYLSRIDFGKHGKISTFLNENYAAQRIFGEDTQLKGVYFEQVKKDHPLVSIDWLSYYDSVHIAERSNVRGRDVYLVELKKEGLPLTTAAVDTETGDIIQQHSRFLVQGAGSIPMTVTYSDFQEQDGIRMAKKMNVFNPNTGNMLIEYESLKTGQVFNPDVFTL